MDVSDITRSLSNLSDLAEHHLGLAIWLGALATMVMAFIASVKASPTNQSSGQTSTPMRRWRWASLFILSVGIAWGPLLLKHYGYFAPSADLRLAPFDDLAAFPLAPYPDESVTMWCFPYEPGSCDIARKYRESLHDDFNMLDWHCTDKDGGRLTFLTGMSSLHHADFKGIKIDTHSEKDRPDGAKDLMLKLQALGVPADWSADDGVGPKDFEIWIGGKP
jgi:hypothetical protein